MKNLQVLVVDDDPFLREILIELLSAWRYDVHAVEDGQKALDYLSQHAFETELVMTDYRMPGMDGLKLTREIKKLWPKIPVIVMSADVNVQGSLFDSDTLELAVQVVGGDAFMQKPFNFSELRTNIVRLCKSQ